jgi:hypothetical protein
MASALRLLTYLQPAAPSVYSKSRLSWEASWNSHAGGLLMQMSCMLGVRSISLLCCGSLLSRLVKKVRDPFGHVDQARCLTMQKRKLFLARDRLNGKGEVVPRLVRVAPRRLEAAGMGLNVTVIRPQSTRGE